MLAADDSGLSDPFARVLISTQCQTTRVRAGLGGVGGGGFGRQSQVGIELFFPQALSLSSCPGFSGQNIGSGSSDLEGGVALSVLGVRSCFLGLT